jgi:hypothetical protein
LYGMNEYLIIAHEMEKARSLARKDLQRERLSPADSSPEGHRSMCEGEKVMYPGTRKDS